MIHVHQPGVYTMPLADYVADPAPEPSLSASLAHLMLSRSAWHAWYASPRLNPDYQSDHSDATDLGTIAHAVLLEGDRAGYVVVDAPDWRTKAAQNARADARAAGKIPLLIGALDTIEAMVAVAQVALRRSELAEEEFDVEQTMAWCEGRDVLTWLRARPDWLSKDRRVIADYKTTDCAQPDAWARGPMQRYGYDLQAALAMRGAKALANPRDVSFIFFVQETKPPYAVSFVSLSPTYLDFANRRLNSAIAQWRHCLSFGSWPSYSPRVAYVEPPGWATFAWEMAQEVKDSGGPISDQL